MSHPRVAVLTAAHRCHEQLINHVGGLSLGTRAPDLHVVIAMSDQMVSRRRLPLGTDRWETVVRSIPTDPRRLPVAAARNLAAELAVERGADVLVFLHCTYIPGRHLLELYTEAVTAAATNRPAVWFGDTAELGPPPATGYRLDNLDDQSVPRVDQPVLPPRHVLPEPSPERFRGASFAISAEDFTLTGGFHEDYLGMGGEDLDFARTVAAAGGSLTWLGGATAYHQREEWVEPTRQHVDALVRNANLYHERWGDFPLIEPLQDLAQRGLARRDDSGRWQVAN